MPSPFQPGVQAAGTAPCRTPQLIPTTLLCSGHALPHGTPAFCPTNRELALGQPHPKHRRHRCSQHDPDCCWGAAQPLCSSWFFQGSTYLWATQHNCPALLHNRTAMGDKLWPALLLLHRHREAGALDQDNQQKGSVFIFLVGRG